MVGAANLLGFAFANADLLMEIDRDATVVFATGATSEFVPSKTDTELVGRGAARLFHPADGSRFVTCARSLEKGGRAGPLRMKLANGKEASVAFCQLPQNKGRISCTLAQLGQRQALGGPSTDTETQLPSKDGFLAAASALADGNNAMTLINVPALSEACAALPAAKAEQLMQQIGQLVRDAGPGAAGRLGDTTFGAIDKAGATPQLVEKITAALKANGMENANGTETQIKLAGGGLSSEQQFLAISHVVDRFAQGEHAGKPGEDLAAVFGAMVSETQERALALTETVLKGSFSLVYQPILHIESGTVAYSEALARFEGGDNTGETVAFAEAMGISDAFDVAVAAKVLSEVESRSGAICSFNLSGNTMGSPQTFGLVAGLLASKRNLAKRILIEVTESAEIGDLVNANKAIQALREMGFQVGLDDFGAGAASFQYLHAFNVDFVKFDRALVTRLGTSQRDDMLVNGLVKLCKELGMKTVAEGIEDADSLKRTRAMSFDYGQGHHLGKASEAPPNAAPAKAAQPAPLTAPNPVAKSAPGSSKRKGEKVWG